VRDEFVLLIVEWPDFLPVNGDDTNQRVFLEHRDVENGAIAAESGRGDDKWIAFEVSLFLSDIGYLRGSFGVGRAPERSIATRTDDRHARAGFGIGQRRVVHGGDSEGVALAQEERSKLGLAEAHRIRQYGLEDRLQFSRRAADDLQDIRGCRLLLQRLGEFLFQAGVGCANAVNASSRLRCLRTKTGNASLALRPFASQDHLVGTTARSTCRREAGKSLGQT